MNNWYKIALTNNNQAQISKIIMQQVFPQMKSAIQSKIKLGESRFHTAKKIKLFIGYQFISSGYIDCRLYTNGMPFVKYPNNQIDQILYNSSGGIIFADKFTNDKFKDKDLSNNIKEIYFDILVKLQFDKNNNIIKPDYQQIYMNLLKTVSHQVKHMSQIYNNPEELRKNVVRDMKLRQKNQSYRSSIFQPFISRFKSYIQPHQVQATVKGVYDSALKRLKINKISYVDFRKVIQDYVYNRRLNIPGLIDYVGRVSDQQRRIINKKAQQMTDIYMQYAQNNLGLIK